MYLGLDIGGTNIKAGILDENNNLIFRDSYPLSEAGNAQNFVERILKFIDEIMSTHIGIKSIGIGAPGVVNEEGIVLVAPNLPALNNLNLADIIRARTSLPVKIDNDANVAAFAELIGAGKDLETFLYVTLGTGVGGGIIYKREIFTGTEGGAGEIGHIIIDENQNPNNFFASYRAGTLEEFTGRKPIIELAKSVISHYPESPLNEIEELDVKHISDIASSGDDGAREILKKVGFHLGIGFASALNLLGIYTVIIGGGISLSDQILFDTIRDTIKLRALPTVASKFVIKIAEFKNDAGITGAALLGKSTI